MAGRTFGIRTAGTIALIVLLLLGILVQQTSPAEAGPLGLLVFFGLLYVLFLLFGTGLLYVTARILQKIGSRLGWRKPLPSVTLTQAYYYGSILALVPVMLLGVQSIGGVGVYDVVLITLFGVIGCFYIAKRMPKT